MKGRHAGRIGNAVAVALAAAALLGGCSSVGTSTLPRDRFDFTGAISRSWEEQILLNIVKFRYMEVPTFVEVNQIVTGYEFRNEVSVSGEFNLYNPTDFFGARGTSGWVDRPTLTYSPLTGSRFTRVLLVPVPTAAILYLVQAGYRADVVLSMFVRSIGGQPNPADFSVSPDRESRFPRIVGLAREVQRAGGLDFRVDPGGDSSKPMTLLVLNPLDRPEAAAKAEELRGLLGIPANATEIPLVTGLLARKPGEVPVFCFSMLQVLMALSSGVEVPAEHVERGWALPPPPLAAGITDCRLTVHSGTAAPDGAFVAVRHLDHWFWVSQDDLSSKRALGVFGILFRSLESGESAGAPILSIATN